MVVGHPPSSSLVNNYKKNISSIKKRQTFANNDLNKGVKYIEVFVKKLRESPRLLKIWDEIDKYDLLSNDYKNMGIWGKIMYLIDKGHFEFGYDQDKKNSSIIINPERSVQKRKQTSSISERKKIVSSPYSSYIDNQLYEYPIAYYSQNPYGLINANPYGLIYPYGSINPYGSIYPYGSINPYGFGHYPRGSLQNGSIPLNSNPNKNLNQDPVIPNINPPKRKVPVVLRVTKRKVPVVLEVTKRPDLS